MFLSWIGPRSLTARSSRAFARSPRPMGLDDVEGAVDFVFAFAVVHEMPGPGPFFSEAAGALKPGANLLLAEPIGHVDDQEFARELVAAGQAGLTVVSRPSIHSCRASLLRKPTT
jgi:SAM-dependent methyltransferase